MLMSNSIRAPPQIARRFKSINDDLRSKEMKNYQKLHYERYYLMDNHGNTTPCTRAACFAAPEERPGCEYRQRWYYDEEAGYALRLPRTQMGEDLGLRNQSDLKKDERYRDRRATQASIDQPRFNDDGNEVGGLDFADDSACVEQIVEDMDTLAGLTRILAQLSDDDRALIRFLLRKARKSEIASYFNITVDGVRYRELQLRKKLGKNPDFQKIRENF